MKKFTAILLSALMLAGCSSSTAATATTAAAESASAEATTAAAAMKVGAGSSTTIETADATADADGKVTINTTLAGVVLDGDVIKYAYFDVAQTKGKFDTKGVLTTTPDATVKTKKELGSDYGMKTNSGIGKEWYEQAEALEQYCIGKTVDEVLNMSVTANDEGSNVPADADLTTSVTIGVDGFLAALKDAASKAVEVEGVASVGTSAIDSASSADATADSDGKVQANVTYAIVALDADGKVVCNMEDVSQQTVKFTTAGAISDINYGGATGTAAPTKMDKKEDYGMKSKSGIGKEWYEQNTAWEEYTVGKTIDEISNTAVTANDEGSNVASDLTTSVTIGIDDLMGTVVKAGNAATALN